MHLVSHKLAQICQNITQIYCYNEIHVNARSECSSWKAENNKATASIAIKEIRNELRWSSHWRKNMSPSRSPNSAFFGPANSPPATGLAPGPEPFGIDRFNFARVISEVAKLTASDAQANDFFGRSVFISGDTIVVGAAEENGGPGDPTSSAGAAYVFVSLDHAVYLPLVLQE
jgi:hypothetical protein